MESDNTDSSTAGVDNGGDGQSFICKACKGASLTFPSQSDLVDHISLVHHLTPEKDVGASGVAGGVLGDGGETHFFEALEEFEDVDVVLEPVVGDVVGVATGGRTAGGGVVGLAAGVGVTGGRRGGGGVPGGRRVGVGAEPADGVGVEPAGGDGGAGGIFSVLVRWLRRLLIWLAGVIFGTGVGVGTGVVIGLVVGVLVAILVSYLAIDYGLSYFP